MFLRPKQQLRPVYSNAIERATFVVFEAYRFLYYASFNSQEKGLIFYLRMIGVRLPSSEIVDV